MTGTAPAQPVRIELAAGVAHLVLDAPDRSANVMDDAYGAGMEGAVRHLAALVENSSAAVRGVVVRSAKQTFFAGGDLDAMTARPRTHETWRWRLEQVQRPLRVLEALPVPVVAAINGAAVGGGLEVALAAHCRIALAGDYPIGLPEVSLGVLAAGGGISRTVRLLGLQRALEDVLLPGVTFGPGAAQRLGLVEAVVQGDVVAAAIASIERLADKPRRRGAGAEGAGAGITAAEVGGAGDNRGWLRALTAHLEHGVADAPRACLRAAVAGAGQPPKNAQRHEVAAFLDLVTGPQFYITLQAAYTDRKRLLRSIPREPAQLPPPVERRFTIATASGALVDATLLGPDLRRGVVELVAPHGAEPGDLEEARRRVRGWGGCPVVAYGSSYVGALAAAVAEEVRHARAEGVSEDVLRSALGRLGLTVPQLGPAQEAFPLPVDDLADRFACAVSLAALAALAAQAAPAWPRAKGSRPHVATVAEANLASIAGVGFPEALGGAVGHVLHHVADGAEVGVAGFARTAERLARRHGDRLALRPDLRAMAHQLADQEENP